LNDVRGVFSISAARNHLLLGRDVHRGFGLGHTQLFVLAANLFSSILEGCGTACWQTLPVPAPGPMEED